MGPPCSLALVAIAALLLVDAPGPLRQPLSPNILFFVITCLPLLNFPGVPFLSKPELLWLELSLLVGSALPLSLSRSLYLSLSLYLSHSFFPAPQTPPSLCGACGTTLFLAWLTSLSCSDHGWLRFLSTVSAEPSSETLSGTRFLGFATRSFYLSGFHVTVSSEMF